ncbi:hypothetical protein [Tautonia plasticadhaerens]|uniref:Uncharacterized protein n=1 Tax=Tautonia plasticadhaerens TaxID=2527974 RepID=A0A518H728_9BACT|nr:hypothetical protein [Tautonia plasticadhaerens]QDV36653.1 hypothetical protein ElP_45820 [Tautonia plasticadhaerens]
MAHRRRRPRRWGRIGCALEIMLGVLFSIVHLGVAWGISGWWPRVLAVPPSDPRRILFSIYWWPPMHLLGHAAEGAGAPAGGITNLMLLPLAWVVCSAYGWLTAIALCLPSRLRRRR